MIRIALCNESAVAPTKANSQAVGFDLTVIGIDEELSRKFPSNTTAYETGVKVVPPTGYYLEIVPRSSISKSGYMLANSVGTIDPDYRGTLKVVLTKVSSDTPDLTLPNKICQLVLRKVETASVEIVNESSLDSTSRADGGFGSTDECKK